VDVLFRSEKTERVQSQTFTLFERIQVLAVNSTTVQGQSIAAVDAGTVTVAVTAHQAKILKVVEGRGELSLILRNPEDDFQFLPFDPNAERTLSDNGQLPRLMPASFATANTANTAAANKADADADRIEGVDRVVGNASERITLEDLLGISMAPREKTMEIFTGANREVLTFEEPAEDSVELLRRGARIQTPIVGNPPVPARRQTAQVQ